MEKTREGSECCGWLCEPVEVSRNDVFRSPANREEFYIIRQEIGRTTHIQTKVHSDSETTNDRIVKFNYRYISKRKGMENLETNPDFVLVSSPVFASYYF